MPLPLPNLDDRRWLDLVEEGRALIPFYAPQWTDHNLHDPGITLLELFAAIAEMDVYRLNRIPERHRRKFLELVGIQPNGPQPAQTVLSFSADDGSAPLLVPAGLEVEGTDVFGVTTRFCTGADLTVVPGALVAVQVQDGGGVHDVTTRWQRGEAFAAFGDDPQPGTALYLGFSTPLPAGVPISVSFSALAVADTERARLQQERQRQLDACQPSSVLLTCPPGWPCSVPDDDAPSAPRTEDSPSPPPHHSVRLVWEVLDVTGQWRALDASRDELEDDTRSLTLSGRLSFTLPHAVGRTRIGAVPTALCYLRARFVAGAYDAPPMLQDVAFNAVRATQAVPIVSRLPLAKGAPVEGEASPRTEVGLVLQCAHGEITSVRIDPDGERPRFHILQLVPRDGVLSVDASFLGVGTGRPLQDYTLPQAPVLDAGFELFTYEAQRWQEWTRRPDFDASGRSDCHYALDPSQGVVRFGDGEKGRTPEDGALIVARCLATRADAGALDRGKVNRIADTIRNRALLPDFARYTRLHVTNTLPATGGAAAETVTHAEGRAVEAVSTTQRAVTLADYETLARQTPGVRLARVSARANTHPRLPCLNALGLITVVILPSLPATRPMPSPQLLQTVAAYLRRRRVIGTGVEVVGPAYIEIAVQARVQTYPRTDAAEVQQRVVAALNRFFHPLTGGPDGSGWPFGRDVYRSEVLQVIDETPGVDHVITLELIADGKGPQCGNVCIGPMGLVAAGPHQIEVV